MKCQVQRSPLQQVVLFFPPTNFGNESPTAPSARKESCLPTIQRRPCICTALNIAHTFSSHSYVTVAIDSIVVNFRISTESAAFCTIRTSSNQINPNSRYQCVQRLYMSISWSIVPPFFCGTYLFRKSLYMFPASFPPRFFLFSPLHAPCPARTRGAGARGAPRAPGIGARTPGAEGFVRSAR